MAREMGKEIVVGPWGGNGRKTWDDGSYNGVRGITVVYGGCIRSISVVYDRNGQVVLPVVKHGGNVSDGDKTTEVELKFPGEYLKEVSGHYSPMEQGGSPVIRSLTFRSNLNKKFGPYGKEEGTPFSLPMEGGQIVGFKGNYDQHVHAIGFHIAKVVNVNVKKASPPKAAQKVSPKQLAGGLANTTIKK